MNYTHSHVFVRRGQQANLSSPYVGPFQVDARYDVNFKIAIPGCANETVSISRVKPAFCSIDTEDAVPIPPP